MASHSCACWNSRWHGFGEPLLQPGISVICQRNIGLLNLPLQRPLFQKLLVFLGDFHDALRGLVVGNRIERLFSENKQYSVIEEVNAQWIIGELTDFRPKFGLLSGGDLGNGYLHRLIITRRQIQLLVCAPQHRDHAKESDGHEASNDSESKWKNGDCGGQYHPPTRSEESNEGKDTNYDEPEEIEPKVCLQTGRHVAHQD